MILCIIYLEIVRPDQALTAALRFVYRIYIAFVVGGILRKFAFKVQIFVASNAFSGYDPVQGA